MASKSIEIKNKKASFEYFLVEEYSAGIALTGTEIKSIRAGKANLSDAYCAFDGHELYVRNMHISPYSHASKSIRAGKANLSDAYCAFDGHELYVRNMHITPYSHASFSNHEPKRERKLLLTARELKKLKTRVDERGYTLVPVMLYINEKGLAKLDIALAKGKKKYDKRESIKQKDVQRDLDRSGL